MSGLARLRSFLTALVFRRRLPDPRARYRRQHRGLQRPVRVSAAAAATLGLMAFALAMVGLYGVVSCLTSQRSHEIGVHIAVGATEGDIIRLVLRGGVTLVATGLVTGLAVTVVAS